MLIRKHVRVRTAFLAVALVLIGSALGYRPLLLTSPHTALAVSADTDQNKGGLPSLTPDKPLIRELSAGEIHAYGVSLSAGQYFHALVEQHGIDASVTLVAPDGQTLVQIACRQREPTPVSFIADVPGIYRLEVRPQEEERDAHGRYELRIDKARPSTTMDSYQIAAEKSYAQGERLLQDGAAESSRAAIIKYKEALAALKIVGDRREEARAVERISDVYISFSDFQNALGYYNQALRLYRTIKDPRGEGETLNELSYIYVSLGENQKALRQCARALRLSRVAGNRSGEAQALDNTGEALNWSGKLQQALPFYRQALSIWIDVEDRRGQAQTYTYLGYTYSDLGQTREAFDFYNQALALWQGARDRRGEAVTLTAMGHLYSRMGEGQEALAFFERAMPLIHQIGDPVEEARVLTGMADVYRGVGENQRALEYYERAATLFRAANYPNGEATALGIIGEVHYDLGDNEQALEYYRRALSIFKAVADRRMQTFVLKEIGRLYDSWGDKAGALKSYLVAREFEEAEKDLREETDTLNLMGRIHEEQGRQQQARECYQRALALSRKADYPFGETATRYNLARAERAGGDLTAARAQAEAALALVESLRAKVASEDLRASYFASVRRLYELYIDLLMESHRQRPDAGYDAAAFEASERARARSLLETLAAARVGVREKVAPELLERERALRDQLNEKVERRMRLPAGVRASAEADALVREIDELTAQYHEVEAQVRAAGTEFTEQSQPQPLSIGEIRARDLDDDTLLLEFSLGEERSYLWLVSKDSLQTYELPPRARIEEAANRVRGLLVAHAPVRGESFEARQARLKDAEGAYWRAASALSEMILAPAASSLGEKRLLVVADGALQYIPFSALPVPGGDEPTPLLVEHEITSQPSASALATLRGAEDARRRATTKAVAVFADPVFEADDSRIELARDSSDDGAHEAESHRETELPQALRDVSAAWDGGSIPRLQASREEAEAITDATVGADNLVRVGFDADKATATSSELSQYRIIHFATHGVLDSEHPELSGLLLSRFDRKGRAKEGFLRLDDIYNLNLPAELVVLSACDTGLGKDVRGEGLVGLVRGFMYAGSARVVASLWNVDDDATAELMARFYRGMLDGKKSPAAALREAQVAMWRQRRWHAPYYWAAFVLQGEYGGRIEVGHAPRAVAHWTLGAAALIISLCCLYAWRRSARTKHR